MTKYSHYIEGKVIPLLTEGSTMKSDVAFVMSHLLKALHNAIGTGLHLAIAFPDYACRSENASGGLGNKVRVFGNESELVAFIMLPEVAMLIGQAAVNFVGGIKTVPDDVKAWVIYSRDRRSEKRTDLYKERENSRRLKKGKDKLYAIKKISSVPYINLSSVTTGQRFSLFIGRKVADAYDGTKALSSYGLNVTLPAF